MTTLVWASSFRWRLPWLALCTLERMTMRRVRQVCWNWPGISQGRS